MPTSIRGGGSGRRWAMTVAVALGLAGQGSPGTAASPRVLRFVHATGSPFRVESGRPTSIVAGDLNGDRKVDLLVTVVGTSGVLVLLGNGRGGFTPAPGPPLVIPTSPHLAALGDLDRDGDLDLVVTGHDSHGVFVWLGDGKGAFAAAPGSPFAALPGGRPHNHGLALADMNADDNLDVLTADDEAHAVSVLLGDGKGSFRSAPGSPTRVGNQPYPFAVGDVDGDGRPDVVVPSVGGSEISVLRGDGRGGFGPGAARVPVAARPYFLALGDLDGDGRLDAVTSHDDASLVTVLRGDGRGGFRAATPPLDAGQRGFAVVLHDLDRDGRVDIVLAAGSAVVVMAGDGRGAVEPAGRSSFAVGGGAWTLAVADLDGDGRSDVATADLEARTVSVLLQK